MDKSEIKQAEQRGHGKVKKVLHTSTILHNGWEMDNAGWIVKMEEGTTKAFTTNHGGVYEWSKQDLKDKIIETKKSLDSLQKALDYWPEDQVTKE